MRSFAPVRGQFGIREHFVAGAGSVDSAAAAPLAPG
jgi:hypothetical protein